MNEEKCPKNLQSLLKFCIQADDGKNLKETDMNSKEVKEKTEWLKKMMAETCINIGQKIVENVGILNQFIDNNESLDNSIIALEDLEDITEHIDYAKDFIKIGGLILTKKLLDQNSEDILIETSQLIGNITQNDEFCQLSAINSGLVELLLDKINNCNNGKVAKKLIFALSCCIRGVKEGIDRFKAANGTRILLDCMGSRTAGEADVKCAFLLFCLANESNDDLASVLDKSEFEAIIDKILSLSSNDPTNTSAEYLVGIVAIAVRQKSPFGGQLSITDRLIDDLSLILNAAQGRPELEELICHINFILENCPIK